jgi:uncharacterized alkaline shock family protein YloU
MTETKTAKRSAPAPSAAKTNKRTHRPKASDTKHRKETAVEHAPIVACEEVATPFDSQVIANRDFIAEPTESPYFAVEQIASEIAGRSHKLDLGPWQGTFPGPADGKYDISKKILARIAALAAAEVPGLAPPRKDLRTRIEDILRGRVDGIRVDVGTTEAAVDILTRVRYGVDIPTVTARLREIIARRIWEMTGLRVVEVNITIQDVTPVAPGDSSSR